MTHDPGGGKEPDTHRDHRPQQPVPRSHPSSGQPSSGQPGSGESSLARGSQHIGALVGALSVLDTRLLDDWGQRLAALLSHGGRLLIAGNGGAAAQAGYLAAQLSVAATGSRRVVGGRGAIALLTAVRAVSAVAGDGSGHEEVFARQVRSHGRPGDVLLTLSASGRNHALLRAAAAARAGGIVAWCLTGPAPNPLADACDEAVCVYPAGARALSLTATVQEAHQVALHLICLSFDAAALAREDAATGSGAGTGRGPAADSAARDGEAAPRGRPAPGA